ncbi:MAG: TlpA disulfide reductase family protein [Deltaproteobacteria bacterium]|nr:TlpA disulfide reductase family protein [Deltaproteobacteria bacterium]
MPNRHLHVYWVTAILVVFLLASSGCFAQERASEFSLRDLNGRSFTLKDYRNKTVLLIFSTTWCPSCRSEIPHFKQIYQTYGHRGLEMANIDIQESRDKVARFAAKYQLPYRILLDEKGDVASAYGIVGVPAMILIKDGVVVTRNYRSVDGTLEKLFRK